MGTVFTLIISIGHGPKTTLSGWDFLSENGSNKVVSKILTSPDNKRRGKRVQGLMSRCASVFENSRWL